VLFCREMGHTGEERIPERPIIGPFREDALNGRVVNGRMAMGVLRHGQALPLHSRVEDPQDEVKDAMVAQLALRPTLGHREGREDTGGELRCGELDGDRRRCRLCCRYAHHARASCEECCRALGNQIASYPTRGWEHLQNSQPLTYEITTSGPILPNRVRRNEVRVTITNHSGHLGEPFGPSPSADFSLPTTPSLTVIDESAMVTDVAQCPAGFTCVPSNPGPFPFMDTGSVSFTKAITNVSAACESEFAVTNIATLVTHDTETPSSTDTTLAGITTPVCSPLIVGCTYTIGFWMTHPEAWPVDALTLGTVSYTQDQLLQILSQPVMGNGLVQLARQLIAAKLNVETEATTPAGVANDITSADLLIGNLGRPACWDRYLAPGKTSSLVASLDVYNNGNAEGGAPHCSE
jgi:hypothetical protein